MPVLAYCITESAAPIKIAQAGVAGMTVGTVEGSGLKCFVSRSPTKDNILGPPAREAALAFHRVLEEIFRQGAIIPFRFPTVLSDDAEMASYLEEHAAEYHAVLSRLHDAVQMEIHLILKDSGWPAKETMPTGTEYLRSRQAAQKKLQAAVGQCRQAGEPWIRGWRERPSEHQIRCFALVARASVAEFERALAGLEVPPRISARVSGPWPASEFISEK